jgi:hypothetical protein
LSLDHDEDDRQSAVQAEDLNGVINENVSNPMHHFFGSGRVFHNLTNGDQFWIGYSYEKETINSVVPGFLPRTLGPVFEYRLRVFPRAEADGVYQAGVVGTDFGPRFG